MKWMWYIMENNKQNNESKEKKEVKVREKLGTMKVCKNCGKTFEKKFNTHFYCSEECRHEVELAQWRIRSQRYRDKKKLEKQQKLEQAQMEQQLEQGTLDATAVDTTDTDNAQ